MNPLLQEFIKFCEEHPGLPFWEALLEWIRNKHDRAFSALLVLKNGKLFNTRKWTGEDHPSVLFKHPVTQEELECKPCKKE